MKKGFRSKSRAQSSIETIVILSIALFLLTALTAVIYDQITTYKIEQEQKIASVAVNTIAKEVNDAYFLGPGTIKTILVRMPNSIDLNKSAIEGRTLVLNVGGSDIFASTKVDVRGVWPDESGTYIFTISSFDDYVSVSVRPVDVSPNQINEYLVQGESTDFSISLTNSSDEDYYYSLIFDFPSPSSSEVSLTSTHEGLVELFYGETQTVNFSLACLTNSFGSYSGKIIFVPSDSSDSNITIPINLFCSSAQTKLQVYPSTKYFYAATSSSTADSVLVCNTTSKDFDSTSATVSGTIAPYVLTSFTGIVSANSCTTLPFIINAPSSVANFDGTLIVKSGGYTSGVDLNLVLYPASSVLNFDWSSAYFGTDGKSINDINLTNQIGLLTITHAMVLFTNDIDDANIIGLYFNNQDKFPANTKAISGDLVNIVDFNLAKRKSYDLNLTFDANIRNDSEKFRIVLKGSDGTYYWSPIFDLNYISDNNASHFSNLKQGQEPIYPRDANLTALWRMNDKNSDSWILNSKTGIRDGNLNNGVDVNGIGLWDTNAVFLDGQNDFILLPDSDFLSFNTTDKLSFSMWVYPKTYTNVALFSKGQYGVDAEYMVYIGESGNPLKFCINGDVGGNQYQCRTTATITSSWVNSWHHIAGTFSGTSASGISIYMDGNRVDTTDYTGGGTYSGMVNQNSGLYVGVLNKGALYPFSGLIDDVAIWNVALSSEEVKEIYSIGSGVHDYNVTVDGNGLYLSTIDGNFVSDGNFYSRVFDFNGKVDFSQLAFTKSTMGSSALNLKLKDNNLNNNYSTSSYVFRRPDNNAFVASGEMDLNILTQSSELISSNYLYDINLIGLWHLNDKNSQGWVLNSKTNIRDGNLWNGADTNAFGLWDTNSGYFDGVNDYAIFDLNKTLTGTTFTFSLWVRPIGAQSTKGIFQVADGLTSINPWILLQRTTSTTTKWYVNGNYQITNTVNDNEWTHLALTFDGTIWRAYKNGIADGTYTGAIGANTGSNFWLGNGYNGYYNGNLEEVAVWDKALSATDINNLYKSQKGSWVDPNLIGYWKLNNKNSSGWVLNSALSYRDSNLWNGADTNGLGLWDTNAGYFDGVNDYVQTNPISLPTSTNFTFSIWVKPNFSSYQQPFIHWGSTASPRLYWRVESSGRMYADTGITSPKMYWNGNLFCSSTDCSGVTPTFANGAWYNLVFTGTYTGTALTNAPILIGSGNPTHPGRYFSGLMDEVKIYNRSLSATEIALDYNRVLSSKFVDSNIVDVSLTMNWDSVKVNSNEFYSFGKQLEDRNSGTSLTTQLTNSNSLFDSNLVGLWHLNDKNSNGWVLNSATNIRDGNLFNSANVNVSGLWDTNAGSFNGSSYVNIGDTFYTGDNITVSAWINSSTLTGVIVGKDASGAREYTLDLLNGYPRFYSDGTGAWGATSGTIISLNTWVHLVGTHNSSGLVNLYINGTLDKTVTSGVTIPNTSTSLRIGGRVYSGSEGYFTGKIEEVAIWDRVLSASEVTSLYKSQANFAEPNLVGLWHLNEASGTTTVADFSGNSNNGTNSVAKNGLTITTSGTDTIYTFKSSGTFTTTSDMNVKVLVVAGGGGGGSFGAGAGAGGLIYNAALPILAQTYSITVGNGGAGATTSNNGIAGLNGSNSIFSSLIAVGGGGGGTRQANMYSGAGASGGSGGGSSMGDSGPQANGGTATSGQGNNGGKGRIGTCPYAHGGGGGAGAVGADGSVSKSGDGGIGLSYDINGSNVYYAGGGGAGAYNGCGVETPGTGGLGGGGAGSASTVGVAGTANSGGGGGGGAHTIAGGAGGSGVVIIRVPTSSTQYITASDGLWNTNGLTLDGVDDYIDMTNSSQLSITGALTLSAWAYTGRDAVQSLMSRWNYGNATYCQYAFGLTPTKALYFYVGNGAGNIFTSTVTANNSFTLNAWHHFVAVYSPSTYMRIYIDGALVKEITASVPATNNNISRPLFIGADYPSNSWFGGKMDEVAIWNRALTATEVNELYRKGVSRLDLNIYSCSDVSCNTKTSSKYLENVNNNTLIDFNSSLASSRYLGFDAYFKKAKGLEDLNANSFYVGSFIKDVNFRYSAGALSLFARTSTNGYSWGDWSALSQSSPQTLSISDANFFQYKSLLSTSVTSVSPVLKDVNVTYTRISN